MSDAQPLRDVQVSSFKSNEELDRESLTAIQSTLGVLSKLSTPSGASFSPSAFTLFPSSHSPSTESQSFLRSLLLSTTQTALANSTSSFLAGSSSESDDYGDIALYLGPVSSLPLSSQSSGSLKDERQILSLMGLEGILSKQSVSIHRTDPPTTHNSLVDKLTDVFTFRVEGANEGTVLFFLIGRYETDWLGLVGIGIWS